jgi:hypothetical protein
MRYARDVLPYRGTLVLFVLHQVQGPESTVRPSRTALPKLATCSLPAGG